MTIPKISDEELARLCKVYTVVDIARMTGLTERNIHRRRARLGIRTQQGKGYPHRQEINIKNGCVIVASDLHIWPGYESVCLRALKKLARELEPVAVILNGDVLDLPQISRHPPMGWESFPEVKEELEAAQDHLNDIEQALKRGCYKIWPLGNHDARFEGRLAAVAKEYKNIGGIHLSDHFSSWQKAWSCWINDEIVVKHRFRGGVHATHNNTVAAGKTMVTGHLHSQKITPFTDYNGTRYGIDTGCVADTDHPAFNYLEDNPTNWRSGFCVLSFRDGAMLYPEVVAKWSDDAVQFRGKIIKC